MDLFPCKDKTVFHWHIRWESAPNLCNANSWSQMFETNTSLRLLPSRREWPQNKVLGAGVGQRSDLESCPEIDPNLLRLCKHNRDTMQAFNHTAKTNGTNASFWALLTFSSLRLMDSSAFHNICFYCFNLFPGLKEADEFTLKRWWYKTRLRNPWLDKAVVALFFSMWLYVCSLSWNVFTQTMNWPHYP